MSLSSWLLPESQMFTVCVIIVSTFVLLPSPGSRTGGGPVGSLHVARPVTYCTF